MTALRPRLALVLALAFATAAEAASVVRDVRLWRAPDHTRIVLDLSAPAAHRSFRLDKPERIVVDLADTRLRAALDTLALDGTPIRAVRHGIRKGDDLRLVFDMGGQAELKVFALKATAQTQDRLVLDFYDSAMPEEAVTVRKRSDTGDRRDIVVAIDAGHGGEDPGALGAGGLREKDVVMGIARELESLFRDEPGFSPTLVRSGDYYVSLKKRRSLARERQADLFLSIHADAFRQQSASGASVYALSLRGATSTTASYLAESENAADLIGGVRLSDKDEVLASVLADLSMMATLDHSLQLGSSVLERLGGVARLHKRDVEQAGFAVLKSPDIPSVLVETGFISNPGEARKLATQSYRKALAGAIFEGVRAHFRRSPPPGTLLAQLRDEVPRSYVIARGDTLSEIAERFNVRLSELKAYNNLNGNRIMVGQTLRIPAS